ncbi:MAG TPA: serine/threonine-protein kinase [Candidatus Bilamarchaeum sp.]|nr:serine/threonine-protein kinase [Candidatus Bilamarchaeum sp.]
MQRQPGASFTAVPDSIRRLPEFKKFHGRIDQDDLVEALRLVNSEICGQYRIKKFLGFGGMGNVYLARDMENERDVAIKIIKQNVVDSPALLARFEREVRATMSIVHPNVIEIYDVGSFSNNKRFCVMELLKGVDLNEVLKSEGPLEWKKLKSVMMQVTAGVGKAHSLHIIHRDLKPANVFLVRSGEEESAKVLDFGMAKFIEEDDGKLTATGIVVGTPSYFAPEQTTGRHDYDGRVDIWATGVMMYELLTGKLPFEGNLVDKIRKINMDAPVPPRVHNPDIPEEVEAIILKCLQKAPVRRFQTMEELNRALAATPGPARYEGSVVSEDLLVKLLQDKGHEDSGEKPDIHEANLDITIAAPPLDSDILDLGSIAVPKPKKRGGAGKVLGALVLATALGVGGYYGYTHWDRFKKSYDDYSRRMQVPSSSSVPSARSPPQQVQEPFMATVRGPPGATVVEITPDNPLGIELGNIDRNGEFHRRFDDGREHTLEVKRRGGSSGRFTVSPSRTSYTVSMGARGAPRRPQGQDGPSGVEFGNPEVQDNQE